MSVLSQVIEEHGIATATIAMVREHAERVKPPRTLFVPFFFGFALGRPNDPDYQHGVLKAALGLLSAKEGPVLEDFPDDRRPDPDAPGLAGYGVGRSNLPAARRMKLRPCGLSTNAGVDNNSGRTAVGLSGVPQRRFRGVIRFLEACAQGDEEADLAERPDGVSRAQFIRYCVDDLKAFYYEARMEQHKGADEDSLHRWFWGDTATGKLVTDLAAVLNESDDPVLKGVAYGLAR